MPKRQQAASRSEALATVASRPQSVPVDVLGTRPGPIRCQPSNKMRFACEWGVSGMPLADMDSHAGALQVDQIELLSKAVMRSLPGSMPR